ncbi:MAG: Methyltransferase type 12 [Candidatus Woesebacteria bacterium GW2011_GWA1_39_12]|uniref:Methyltransferase type 12 n=1 Tax=Candidatus Woesebacteria bacterium GW2011_GWA1_39_12 TaxID=1618549 RepID=A0A0G0LXI9_9BACT|nr:MAG: Methyltransferase type 12 [Candidatus Woesebacteria bacterium GW2011_GWA1_39_12]
MQRKDLIDKTIGLYADAGWKRWFSRIRFWDAPYIEVEKLVPAKGTIVDLGCGEGIFTNYLGLAGSHRKVLGIEIDEERVGQADRGVKNVSFKRGNAVTASIPKCDCIVIFHLLHHLPSYSDQEKVLHKAKKALNKGGVLIIVEVDIKPSIKYLIAWFTDHFLVPWIFEKRLYSPIYFRKRKDWINLLNEMGFSVGARSAEAGMPFSHIIFTCEPKQQ